MRGKGSLFRSCFGGCTSCVKYEADVGVFSTEEASEAVNGVKETRDVGTMVPQNDSSFHNNESASQCEELKKKPGDEDEAATEVPAKQKTSLPLVLESPASKRGASLGSAFEERSSASSPSSVGEVDEAPPAEQSSTPAPPTPNANAVAGEAAVAPATRSHKERLHHHSDVINATTPALLEATAGEGVPRHPGREERLSCHPILMREWSLASSIASDEEVEGEGNASDYE